MKFQNMTPYTHGTSYDNHLRYLAENNTRNNTNGTLNTSFDMKSFFLYGIIIPVSVIVIGIMCCGILKYMQQEPNIDDIHSNTQPSILRLRSKVIAQSAIIGLFSGTEERSLEVRINYHDNDYDLNATHQEFVEDFT